MALPRYLSAEDVKALLGCKYNTALKTMRAAGATKVGALVRVREDRLQAHLDSCHDPASHPTSRGERIVPDFGPTSPGLSPTLVSGPRTKKKPKGALPNCSSLAEYDRLLRSKAR